MDYSQTIKVDIRDHQTYEQIYTKQYDKGYPLIFEITKDKEPFDLTGVTADFRMTKPDGNIILINGTVSSNKVSVDLTEQMTAVYGKSYFEISLNQNSQTITTITGIIKTDKSVIQSEAVSQSVIDIIIQSVQEARQCASDALESANNSESSAERSAESATLSRSWAVGDTNTRDGENTNNSKYYSEQSADFADNASDSAILSRSWAVGDTNTRTGEETNNSKYFSTQSENSANNSANSATLSESWAIGGTNSRSGENTNNSKYYSNQAYNSATNASNSATSANNSATIATTKAGEAGVSATNAASSESNALTYSKASQSYAVGTGNYRPDESSDNAKYYYEQAKAISESLGGTLIPMGTITFSQLPSVQKSPGYMYNISNEFTTTSDFKEGSGITMPAGTNVYYTADEMWDCLAGSPVTGIKGDNETSYRRGNVNITKADIGLGNVANKLSQAEIVSDTEPTNQEVGDFWMQEYT